MTWKIHEKETRNVISMSGQERYDYFVLKVADWEAVWSLKTPSGWCLFGEINERRCFPVWPHARYAEQHISGAFSDAKAEIVELNGNADLILSQFHRFILVPLPPVRQIILFIATLLKVHLILLIPVWWHLRHEQLHVISGTCLRDTEFLDQSRIERGGFLASRCEMDFPISSNPSTGILSFYQPIT